MRRPTVRAGGLIAILAAVAGVFVWAAPVLGQESIGRHRVVQMDGRTFEGDVTETADAYLVEVGRGIKVTVPKHLVKELTPVAAAEAAAAGETEVFASTDLVSGDEIQRILGPSENFAVVEEFAESAGNAMEEAPVNEESLAQMLRIAGEKADSYETPHFLLVYTTDRGLAAQLGARLESVYRWNVRLMEMMGVPTVRPDYKLETYFFATHDEFKRYAAYDLGMSDTGGILGFYYSPTNRSAFFDMMTFEPFARALEAVKRKEVPHQERQRVTNLIRRKVEYMNLEVIQHEAAHHIHFNIGMFNPRSDRYNKFVSEGMAVQFEVPPTRFGASLGALNHERLRQYRQIWANVIDQTPMDFMRAFLWHGTVDYSGAHYSLGWAMIYYLRKEHFEGFAKFMKAISEWDDDVEITITEKQKLFEENFGELNEEWVKNFAKFMSELQLRTDQLPPDFP